jgi:hypothetical protein
MEKEKKDYYRMLVEVCSEDYSKVEHVEHCIKNGAKANAENSYPLRMACHYSNLDIIRFLLTSPEIKKPSI